MKNKKPNNKFQALIIFLKGFAMGFVDIIPGVSGGTIALITGIYQRLVGSISDIDVKMPFYLLKGDFKRLIKSFKEIDLELFVPLLSGILLAILLMSHLMSFILKNYPGLTNAFFFGLILASAIILFKRVKKITFITFISLSLGFIFAYFLVKSPTLSLNHSLLMIFLSGVIAICAMILPGISGSFVLYLLNQYEYMLNSVINYKIIPIALFSLGALLGIIGFSKLLKIILKKYHSETLYFLIGLMLGALFLPYKAIANAKTKLLWIIISGLTGFILITIFHLLSKGISNENN